MNMSVFLIRNKSLIIDSDSFLLSGILLEKFMMYVVKCLQKNYASFFGWFYGYFFGF